MKKGSEPSLDTLKHIAKYYNVSIKDLVESDLKDYKVALTNEFYNVMFPIVASEEALKDDDFRKGYDLLCKIKEEAISKISIPIDLINTCWNLLLKSWEGRKREETAVNLLSLNMMIFSSIVEEVEFKYIESLSKITRNGMVMEQVIRDDSYTDFIQNRNVKNIAHNENKNKIKIKFIQDNEENVVEYLEFLKKTLEWNQLGDYFCALRYFIGMVDNGKTIVFNMELGEEWMSSLFELGNKYAIDFYAVYLKFYGYTLRKYND